MKKFMDIENLRLEDVELNGNVTRKNNVGAFEIGDELIVQEKIDGSCASFHYLGNGKFECYSRRRKLSTENNLDGFYQYCEKIAKRLYDKEKSVVNYIGLVNDLAGGEAAPWEGDIPEKDDYFDYHKFILFGEWTGKRNKIIYKKNPMNEWFVFDAYEIGSEEYINQDTLNLICEEIGLTRVKTLAHIFAFKGWETILPFANPDYSFYGDTQEGIVIKNQTKLNLKKELRDPIYIKIVNKKFRETQNVKNIDPEKEQALENAQKLLSNVVTEQRVSKVLCKLCEDGELPKELGPKDLGIIAKKLPKAVFIDVQKEEPEILEAAGKQGGKVCGSLTMSIAREIVAGN